MKTLVLQKGTFIVVEGNEENLFLSSHKSQLIGLVSEILKDDHKSESIVDHIDVDGCWYFEIDGVRFDFASDAFQSLCTKYELKESDLLIRKL